MANVIKIKRSNVQGKVPEPGSLDFGELAINTYDGKLFLKMQEGANAAEVVAIGQRGYTGSQGYVGSQGVQGYTGSQGPIGYTGSAFGGDYVQSLVAGTGVTLANNSGTGATPTISIGQDVSTSADVEFNNVTLNTGGVITFADTTEQETRAPRLYTNADIETAVFMAGDYYYDDINANIYLVLDITQDGPELQDLTVRA